MDVPPKEQTLGIGTPYDSQRHGAHRFECDGCDAMPNLAQKWGLDLTTWQRWEDDTTSISLSIESSPLGPDVATRMQDTWEVGSWEKLGSWERMPMDREREKAWRSSF